MVAFIVSVVLTAAGATVSAGWHVLSRNGSPEFEDLGVGFDILVGAIVMQVAFIPGSHGEQAPVRWGGVGVLFIVLMVMAVATRFLGYGPALTYSRPDEEDLIVYPMKSKAVIITSSVGCAALCAFLVAQRKRRLGSEDLEGPAALTVSTQRVPASGGRDIGTSDSAFTW